MTACAESSCDPSCQNSNEDLVPVSLEKNGPYILFRLGSLNTQRCADNDKPKPETLDTRVDQPRLRSAQQMHLDGSEKE